MWILFVIIMIFNISYGDVIEYNNNRVYPDAKTPIDDSTVEIINDYYIKDKNRYYGLIYYISSPSKGIPALPERLYMREKNIMTTVAVEEKPVKIKDEYFFSKDKVYYRGKEIEGANPRTIKLLSNGVSKDGKNIYFENRLFEIGDNFYNIGKNYFRQDNKIYVVYYSELSQLQVFYPYDIGQVEGIDISTAKIIGKNYIKDKNNIYYNHFRYNMIGGKIPGADMKSFKVLDEFFSKDKSSAYFKWYKIEGADAKTFKVLQYWYSRDKNNLYGADSVEQKIGPGEVEFFNRYVYRVDGKYYMKPFYNKNKYDENGTLLKTGVEEIDGNLELKKINDLFFILGNKLYYRDFFGVHLINIEDPEKFIKIEYDYYTDGKDIYYFGNKLEGIDKGSMKIINEHMIEDKDYIYYGKYPEKK